jgi:hypothetical protein
MAGQTIGSYLVRTLGWRGAARVSRLITAWALGEAMTGTSFRTLDGFLESEWNRTAAEYPRATLYRDLKDFRKAFPDYSTPADLVEAIPTLRRAAKREDAASLSAAVFRVEWAS